MLACENKTLSVTAIEEGTVVDHIRAGAALMIVRYLLDAGLSNQMTIGLNLKSRLLKSKDLIKIEKLFLSEDQTSHIALFAPEATINVISNYQVIQKTKVALPMTISRLLACPNRLCITNLERVATQFKLIERGCRPRVQCLFCEKINIPNVIQKLAYDAF